MLYGNATFTSPMDLYITDPTDNKTAKITDINNNILTKVRMGEYEQFSFAGWNNETVYGYVIKPVDFDSSKNILLSSLSTAALRSRFTMNSNTGGTHSLIPEEDMALL